MRMLDIIPRNYATLDNTHVDNQTSIINMEGKLCDKIVCILIDPGSNYSYVNLNPMCGLRKYMHAKCWLV